MENRVLKIINSFEIYVGACFLGIMIFLLFLQVVSRYVFNRAIAWTEEVALIFFVLSIYCGSSAAIKRNQHIRMAMVLSKFGMKGRNVLLIFGNLCFFVFNCIVLTGLHTITVRLYRFDTRSALTGFPRWIIYAVVVFLFILTNIRLVQDSIEKIKMIRSAPSGLLVTENVKK